ncbi:lipopolysaccharide-induced tumor necrosis factor-alpha factor homolog isoform X1 [Tubulanus polymorphus]|uniref:lipopolysaccharide-induced tumor necrosis factor-alpha factor homolog isoform X1 n=1 Tax=Tubulanus polymorphus TaxID=672921 RepID=UPI003DA32BC3
MTEKVDPPPAYGTGYPPQGPAQPQPAYGPGPPPPPQGSGYGTGYPPQGPAQPQSAYGPGPPPPPQGYVTPQGGPVNVTSTVVVANPNSVLPGYPTNTFCPSCMTTVGTNVEYQIGLLCWLIVGVLIIFGCWLGCCLIPFCVDSCKDAVHRCQNCGRIVGIHKVI